MCHTCNNDLKIILKYHVRHHNIVMLYFVIEIAAHFLGRKFPMSRANFKSVYSIFSNKLWIFDCCCVFIADESHMDLKFFLHNSLHDIITTF